MGSSRTTDGRSICRSRSDKDHPLPVRRSPLSSTSAPLFFWSPDLFAASTRKYPSECHRGRWSRYDRRTTEDPRRRVALSLEPEQQYHRYRLHNPHLHGRLHPRARSDFHRAVRVHVSADRSPPVPVCPGGHYWLRRIFGQGDSLLVGAGDRRDDEKSVLGLGSLPERIPLARVHPSSRLEEPTGSRRGADDRRIEKAPFPRGIGSFSREGRTVDSRQELAD